jgi:hypothetical protein
MTDRSGDSPERLLDSDATDFERRLLQAAVKDGPSRDMSARMARALGVSVATAATMGAATKAGAGGGSASGWPWVVGGVIGLSVVGALVVGSRWTASRPDARPAGPAVSQPVVSPPAPVAAGAAVRAALPLHDLHGEIDLLDGARAAIAARAGGRALDLLRRYEDLYPTGSFRPEAAAVRVEALVQLGYDVEARALAERFVAEHRGSLLSDRVAAIAGLRRR